MRRVARKVGIVLNCWRIRTLWAYGLALLMILGTAATPDATPGQIVYVQNKVAEVRAEPNHHKGRAKTSEEPARPLEGLLFAAPGGL